jgi:hypothetical protein
MRPLGITGLCFLFCTSGLQAQLGFLDKVFANVTDVNASYLIGRSSRGNELVSDKNGKLDMHGIGFEVALNIGTLVASKIPSECDSTRIEYIRTQREVRNGVTTYIDTAKEVRAYPDRIKAPDGTIDTLKKKRYDEACSRSGLLEGEVSLGYSQLGGFAGRNVRLQGSLENLPALGIYAVFSPTNWAAAYLGVRTGIAQLKGFQAFPGDTGRVTASGSTWQIGIAPGFSVGPPGLDGALFAEFEWMHRKFDDIQWTSVQGPVPLELRRPTHLSTFVISVGGQIGLGEKDPD